ncbi:ABC transporter permease [Peptococcaceae bacterium SCADC1_2_3]|jgi:urea transport system permease protein|nr:ABC transporter permease [Peptococcaceae bacterium SCADC1_2_3]KFI37445.1 ABC transporter permease [Peptococcaceae bacterium SCADC1_2_3]
MEVFLLQVFNGLSVSSILLLTALGLAITFGLMNVINMAHGELIMTGSYVTYVVQMFFLKHIAGNFDLYYPVALILSFFVTAFIGFLLERSLIRFLYERPLDTLLATWGVGMIFQQIARDIFGAPNLEVRTPHWLKGGVEIMAGLQLPYNRLFIIILAIFCLIGVYFYMYHTASGCRMRAVMQNRSMASCLGISIAKVDAYTFALGSGLAGIAGCALCLLGPIGPSLGTYYIVDAFMVVVLGGVGKLVGIIISSGVVGGLNTAFEFGSTATMGKVLALIMVILFLRWKPSGLISLKVRALD